jgi:hypothetical protein
MLGTGLGADFLPGRFFFIMNRELTELGPGMVEELTFGRGKEAVGPDVMSGGKRYVADEPCEKVTCGQGDELDLGTGFVFVAKEHGVGSFSGKAAV